MSRRYKSHPRPPAAAAAPHTEEDALSTKPDEPKSAGIRVGPNEPDPDGISTQVLNPESAVWLEGHLHERGDSYAVVSFSTDVGGVYLVTIMQPNWTCDQADVELGDKIHVLADFDGRIASVLGHSFFPARPK